MALVLSSVAFGFLIFLRGLVYFENPIPTRSSVILAQFYFEDAKCREQILNVHQSFLFIDMKDKTLLTDEGYTHIGLEGTDLGKSSKCPLSWGRQDARCTSSFSFRWNK